MALAPIDTKPLLTPQGGRYARPEAPQGGQRGGPAEARGSHFVAAATGPAAPLASAPAAGLSTEDDDDDKR